MLRGAWMTLAVLLVLCDGSFRILVRETYRNRRHRQRHAPKLDVEDSGPDGRPRRHLHQQCPRNCILDISNMQQVRSSFQDFLEEPDTRLVYFKVTFPDHPNETVLEKYPYMKNNFQSDEWVWTSGNFGKKLLGLPLDADVLSLYIMSTHRKYLDLRMTMSPPRCLILSSPECRLYLVRDILVHNVTFVQRHKHRRDFVCHRVINETDHAHSHLIYRCCDTTAFRNGDILCQVYSSYGREISGVLTLINIIAFLITLFSPIIIMKVKIALKYDSNTKFFRASLKHGITGQRNYVIRISSRQLINLNDPKPFSIPRFIFRLLFHCYGEGRCCIHWWGEWRHQPNMCRKESLCTRCWFNFWRFFAVIVIYPIVFYLAIALYAPRLEYYISILKHMEEFFQDKNPMYLNINILAASLIPFTLYSPAVAVWMLFSFVAYIYTVLLLSWPNNPLERCLLRYEGKRTYEQPNVLYDRMTRGYKAVLQKLAYGEFKSKRHFFRIPWIPWGMRRSCYFFGRLFMQIPIINVCFTLLMFDSKLFNLREKRDDESDRDESVDSLDMHLPSRVRCCKWLLTIFVWIGFIFILVGYCTSVFVMVEFVLNVLFFTILGAVLHAYSVLPWICFALVVFFYFNDTLSEINREHCEILKLIDENSPRISAVEDSEEVFRDGAIQILKTHNLGAVKFIDGDNTEYVSKELYYNVCTDLKCGWNRSFRRIFIKLSIIVLFVLFVFLALTALGAFIGSGLLISVAALVASTIPKLVDLYVATKTRRPDRHRALWAKIMPDILDRHIRVDRTLCEDNHEEDLTTYDVRPVGLLEMEIPRMSRHRTLRLWKFPWVVSADQQTQSHETFIIALANKLAAASFLSKIVTRAYSHDLTDENVLRQWCLLVENCIIEGSATANGINGVPMDSIRLFPRDVQPLVSPFDTGDTIDNVVDQINRELYGPYTKGVLVTIGNTSFALGKLDNTIFAFNGSCHGDQVTDLFGAVLIATDFNTQNLQTIIKFIVDPYSPDAVPVYSIVPIEGFVFRSPEILETDFD